MPDYIGDLRHVAFHGEGSELHRQIIFRKIKKLEAKLRSEGIDVNLYGQQRFCEALTTEKTETREWMKRLVISRLTRGDFSDWTGWEYRNDWALGSYSPEVPNKRWRLEASDSLAVLGEQGIGDEIMFGSVIPDAMLRCKKVVFECDPRLVDVFARSLGISTKPRADITGRGDPVIKYLTKPRDEEYFIPVGDLARLFRKDIKHFPGKPFLKPLPEMVDKWAHLRGRTGLAWRSRTGQFKPGDLGVKNPVVLQYDWWQHETESLGPVDSITIPDCDLKDGLEDLLGICANLERVVTVPQTIAHIAGSIGTKVDVILPPVGTSRVKDTFRWRYTPPKMRWYSDVTVYENERSYKSKMRGA